MVDDRVRELENEEPGTNEIGDEPIPQTMAIALERLAGFLPSNPRVANSLIKRYGTIWYNDNKKKIADRLYILRSAAVT